MTTFSPQFPSSLSLIPICCFFRMNWESNHLSLPQAAASWAPASSLTWLSFQPASLLQVTSPVSNWGNYFKMHPRYCYFAWNPALDPKLVTVKAEGRSSHRDEPHLVWSSVSHPHLLLPPFAQFALAALVSILFIYLLSPSLNTQGMFVFQIFCPLPEHPCLQ